MRAENTAIKRPGWVWVISIWYVVSTVLSLATSTLLRTGAIPLAPVQRAYLESLSAVDWAFSIAIALVYLIGAVAIFLLRRAAFYLFTFALIATILQTLWHVATKSYVAAMGGAGVVGIGMVTGLGLVFAVCLYCRRLIRRGVLR